MNSSNILLLTCVHYNDQPNVMTFVNHILGLPLPEGWTLHVAIGDNSGTWDRRVELPENVCVYKPDANRGYLRGCAFAHAKWIAEHEVVPALVGVSNTDLILEPDFFVQLLTAELPESVVVLAPHITLPEGTPQNPFLRERPNRSRMFGYTVLYRSPFLTGLWQTLHHGKNRLRRAGKARREQLSPASLAPDCTPYAAHGSLFFLRPNFFVLGGTLDYPGFLFGEEIFIAEQVRTFQLQVAYLPAARLLHTAHASTDRVTNRRRTRWMHESACFLWKQHFS